MKNHFEDNNIIGTNSNGMSRAETFNDGLGKEIGIFFALFALTALTIASSFFNLGILNTVIVLSIAFLQTLLVLIFFMHLNESSGFVKLLTYGSFLWVGIMFVMTLNDFASRQFVASKVDTNTWITRSAHQYAEGPALPESHH